MLRELRAGILQQAIPLCLSFCLSVLNSPSALIHSHIQFPALSIHQSPHFVSADFIGARSPSRCSHPEAAGEPPPAASPLPDLLTEGPSGGLSFSIARPAKTLILNLIPIVLLFTFSIEGNGSEEDTRREKRWGGKRWGDGGGGAVDNGERCLLNFLEQFAHQSGGGSIQLPVPYINRNHREKM